MVSSLSVTEIESDVLELEHAPKKRMHSERVKKKRFFNKIHEDPPKIYYNNILHIIKSNIKHFMN